MPILGSAKMKVSIGGIVGKPRACCNQSVVHCSWSASGDMHSFANYAICTHLSMELIVAGTTVPPAINDRFHRS